MTGATGMLGREVVRAAADHEVVGLTHGELDITDPDAVAAAVDDCVVVNCAGFTDVDAAEADEAGATELNGDAAGYLAAAAHSIVQPSTSPSESATNPSWLSADATPAVPSSALHSSRLRVRKPRAFGQ